MLLQTQAVRSKVVSALSSIVVYGLVGTGLVTAYNAYAKKQARLARCVDIPDNKYIKVHYCTSKGHLY